MSTQQELRDRLTAAIERQKDQQKRARDASRAERAASGGDGVPETSITD